MAAWCAESRIDSDEEAGAELMSLAAALASEIEEWFGPDGMMTYWINTGQATVLIDGDGTLGGEAVNSGPVQSYRKPVGRGGEA
jgi:hypothetical protein